jgi:hypothetical protein
MIMCVTNNTNMAAMLCGVPNMIMYVTNNTNMAAMLCGVPNMIMCVTNNTDMAAMLCGVPNSASAFHCNCLEISVVIRLATKYRKLKHGIRAEMLVYYNLFKFVVYWCCQC